MNTLKLARTDRFLLRRVGLCAARCVMLAASNWAAAAGGAYTFDKDASGSMAPWTPDIVTAVDEYVPDPAFNHGYLGRDHFAAANSLDQVGAVTAQLANGDMVVAGLVPDGVGGGFCGDGTKLCSIGLVKYSATGQRVTWPNAGANGRFSNNYFVYPGGSSSFQYQYIRDIKVRGIYIDVMVDEPDRDHTALTLGHRNVHIFTFSDDGLSVRSWPAFGLGVGAADNVDFYGGQMVVINSTTMIVTATAYDSVGPFIAVTRLRQQNNGYLESDNGWGSVYGGGLYNRIIRYYAPADTCSAPPCNATTNYAVKPVGDFTEDFYVAGSVQFSGDDWDVATLKISSQTGALKSAFGGDGWVTTAFDQLNSTGKDLTAGIYAYQNDVYLAGQVAQKCHDGIGVAKLNGATGGANTAFGGVGKVVFGGQGNAQFCFGQGPQADVPTGISATGGRIGIAGYRGNRSIVTNAYSVDPMLAVVNAVNGQVLDIDSHPIVRADGTRYGDAVLYGIYGGPLATSPFTVAGNGRDASAGNTLSYVAGKFIPVSADRIFASGFDN